MRVGGKAEVRFNYLGQFDQVFKEEGLLKPAGERSGASQAEENGMGGGLDVSGLVAGGRVRMERVYREGGERGGGEEGVGGHSMAGVVGVEGGLQAQGGR